MISGKGDSLYDRILFFAERYVILEKRKVDGSYLGVDMCHAENLKNMKLGLDF